jgi:hypothetical protein
VVVGLAVVVVAFAVVVVVFAVVAVEGAVVEVAAPVVVVSATEVVVEEAAVVAAPDVVVSLDTTAVTEVEVDDSSPPHPTRRMPRTITMSAIKTSSEPRRPLKPTLIDPPRSGCFDGRSATAHM